VYCLCFPPFQILTLLTDFRETSNGHYASESQSRAYLYRRADNSLALPTSGYILFDGENISFDASLVIYINSTNIPSVMIINRIYENQNLLSL
jgi:hypothetical protein